MAILLVSKSERRVVARWFAMGKLANFRQGALLSVVLCATTPSSGQQLEAPQPALPGNVVEITAGDFFFTAPDSVPAGLTTFQLKQIGAFTHDLSILQLPPGKSVAEFAALVEAGEPRPWAKNLGGPGFIDPPLSTNVTLVLEPGMYALACFVTTPKDPPEHLRMVKPLQVVASTTALSREPPTDLVIRILDDGYEFSPSLSAGRHLLRVENATTQRRLFRMERVLPGRTPEEAIAWGRQRLTVPDTVRPTESKGRLSGFEPGQHLIMTVDLEPGTYLVSSLPNRATSQVFVVQ
jgi:hypothetical protein